MEPIHWVIFYFVLAGLVSLVASKKGRSGLGYLGILLVAPAPLMFMMSYALGDNMSAKPLALWSVAFLCPVAAFIVAIMSDTAQQVAVAKGEYGDYVKCPFCAESVRREAIKCKHCGSALPHAEAQA